MAGTTQLVAFLGNPASLCDVAQRLLKKGSVSHFLCVLEEGEISEGIRRAWEFSVQPLWPHIHLVIMHCPRGKAFEAIAEYAEILARQGSQPLDVLFLSDESTWFGSRRLANELNRLQQLMEKSSSSCLVRRI